VWNTFVAGHLTQVNGKRGDVSDVTTMIYDDHGFVRRTIDATGHGTTTITDAGNGQLLASIDENNTTTFDSADKATYYFYDALGRRTAVRTAEDPVHDAVQYLYSLTNTAPSSVQTRVEQSTGVWLDSWTYFDGLGRVRETQRPGPNGGRIISATQYDGGGLAVRTLTDQYVAGTAGAGMWSNVASIDGSVLASETRTSYDHLSRPTNHFGYTHNNPAIVSGALVQQNIGYLGHSTVVQPAVGSPTTTHTNALGQVDYRLDYNTTWVGAKTTLYGYDLNGNQTTVTDPKGNVTTTVYDNYGRKTDVYDPDAGRTMYSYWDDNTLKDVTVAAGTWG